jgi:hypothetical protein
MTRDEYNQILRRARYVCKKLFYQALLDPEDLAQEYCITKLNGWHQSLEYTAIDLVRKAYGRTGKYARSTEKIRKAERLHYHEIDYYTERLVTRTHDETLHCTSRASLFTRRNWHRYLNDQEGFVCHFHFDLEMTQSDVAILLDVNLSRISQVLRMVEKKLRAAYRRQGWL